MKIREQGKRGRDRGRRMLEGPQKDYEWEGGRVMFS